MLGLSEDQRIEALIIFTDSKMANKKEIVNGLKSSGSTSIFYCLLNAMNEYDEAKRLHTAFKKIKRDSTGTPIRELYEHICTIYCEILRLEDLTLLNKQSIVDREMQALDSCN